MLFKRDKTCEISRRFFSPIYLKNRFRKQFSVNLEKQKKFESKNSPVFVYDEYPGYSISFYLSFLILCIIMGHNFYAFLYYPDVFTNGYSNGTVFTTTFLQILATFFGMSGNISYNIELNRFLNSEPVIAYCEMYKDELLRLISLKNDIEIFPIIIIIISFLNLFLHTDGFDYYYTIILHLDLYEPGVLDKVSPFLYYNNFSSYFFILLGVFVLWTQKLDADILELKNKINNENK